MKWEEACREIENLKKTVRELHQENENLSTIVTSQGEDIYILTYKLEELETFVRILNKAQDMSNIIMEDEEKPRNGVCFIKDIQVEEKNSTSFVSIGFDYSHVNKKDHMFQH